MGILDRRKKENEWQEKKVEWLKQIEAQRKCVLEILKEDPHYLDNMEWKKTDGVEFYRQAAYPLRDTYVRNLLYGTAESYEACREKELEEELEFMEKSNIHSQEDFNVIRIVLKMREDAALIELLKARSELLGYELQIAHFERNTANGKISPEEAQGRIGALKEKCAESELKCRECQDAYEMEHHYALIGERIYQHRTYEQLVQTRVQSKAKCRK